MIINEIIVVEGKNDTNKIKQAVDADTIETNGSAINEETIQLIKHAQRKRGVIIFTDPDYPGERIRKIIHQHVPGCKHAFLPKSVAQSKTKSKIGIEHASISAIQNALRRTKEEIVSKTFSSDITKMDLIALGLIGKRDSKRRREQLGNLLSIGYTNSKQLLKRLELFQISKEELNEAMQHILERGD